MAEIPDQAGDTYFTTYAADGEYILEGTTVTTAGGAVDILAAWIEWPQNETLEFRMRVADLSELNPADPAQTTLVFSYSVFFDLATSGEIQGDVGSRYTSGDGWTHDLVLWTPEFNRKTINASVSSADSTITWWVELADLSPLSPSQTLTELSARIYAQHGLTSTGDQDYARAPLDRVFVLPMVELKAGQSSLNESGEGPADEARFTPGPSASGVALALVGAAAICGLRPNAGRQRPSFAAQSPDRREVSG